MSSTFRPAVDYVIQNEGETFENVTHDRGGATKFGITFGLAQRYGVVTVGQLQQMTRERAESIYYQEFWRYSDVEDQRVATKLLDLAVNMGEGRAVQVVQIALAWLHGGLAVVDGLWGPKTLAAVNAADADKLLHLIVEVASSYYRTRVVLDATQKKFINGWLTRAVRLPT
jgi:lysozyme family protein